ncbi:hypothetical protein CDAR_580581 [Caerostris darwini]|uniref:Uncharacterized protein n=1 Tax=Caerostris darwini TaxID=1538125 RepID=A0AAV4R5B6_9ARAC|nr:hypothetical protein CDAR_580581 [Caerostris darwini]
MEYRKGRFQYFYSVACAGKEDFNVDIKLAREHTTLALSRGARGCPPPFPKVVINEQRCGGGCRGGVSGVSRSSAEIYRSLSGAAEEDGGRPVTRASFVVPQVLSSGKVSDRLRNRRLGWSYRAPPASPKLLISPLF